jgi:hypothetical protein
MEFDEVSLSRLLEVIEYPLLLVQVLAGKLAFELRQVNPL